MGDTFALHQALAAGARSAVIVGGGYIGLEMAEAFTARGLAVTLVEQAPAVMPTVDVELGRLLGEELGRHDVEVVNDVTVKAIRHDAGGRLTVAGEPDFTCAQLQLRVAGDRQTGRLLGAQLLGDHRAQVAKRIDIPAAALFHHLTVEGLSDLDLSYTPPFGSPWDAVQMAAQAWTRQVHGSQPTPAASHQTRP
jgi:pyruvate/2-oxoglutarate dehydrogenase complex dihydrolipoamide dehydrogenase (E3) component